MSKEEQDFSIEYQMAAIAVFAERYGYEICRTYADRGISGVGIKKRSALQTLLSDALSRDRDFEAILVYDVSRWGRFQNIDQSAHYEFICSEAGVGVEYCTEPFLNDGSPTSSLFKHIKRTMAAEYSRELSVKTKSGKHGLRKLGYWTSGPPGFGFRRQIVLQSLFNSVRDKRSRRARNVSRAEALTDLRRVLSEQGVLNKSVIMQHGRVTPGMHARRFGGLLGAYKAIGYEPSLEQSMSASRLISALSNRRRSVCKLSDDELLRRLGALFHEKGRLTIQLIDEAPEMPAASTFSLRFGTIIRAYEKVGYTPNAQQLRIAKAYEEREQRRDGGSDQARTAPWTRRGGETAQRNAGVGDEPAAKTWTALKFHAV
jgi:DNA invertase Pin-like site-specific DNA recombinase